MRMNHRSPDDDDPAQAAYRAGDFERAAALQLQRLQAHRRSGTAASDDHVRLGAYLWSAGRSHDALAALREADALYPRTPQVLENIGVMLSLGGDAAGARGFLERALDAGSTSLNVLDALGAVQLALGERDAAIATARRSLEAKDARFGGAPVLAAIPSAAPPPFDATPRRRHVISYTLWGDQPRYLAPMLENLRLAKHLFPRWVVRIHADPSVPADYRREAEKEGAEWQERRLAAGEPVFRRLLWRFEVAADPALARFLVRDADALLTVKERVAVDDWLRSGRCFHMMRDFPSHCDLVLAGLWGGVAGVLPPVADWLAAFRPWRLENAHVDQDLLSGAVWSTLKQSLLVHDSVFTGCLGSVPFPPYGDLPPGQHVGQNAFIHFRPERR